MKKKYLPILLLWIAMIITLIEMVMTDYSYNIRHYLGLGALAIATALLFKHERGYRYFMAFLLALGIFNLIEFLTYKISLNLFGLELQLFSLVVSIVFILIYRNNIVNHYQQSITQTPEERQSVKTTFKNKFIGLSTQEIEKRLNEDLVPEAIQALKEIKEERKNVL